MRLATPRMLAPAAWLGLFAVLALTAVGAGRAESPAQLPPILDQTSSAVVPGQYILVFGGDVSSKDVLSAQQTVRGLGGKILFTYGAALNGFSATIPDGALDTVRAIPGIRWIEANQRVTADWTTQTSAPTGLDRTDRRLQPLNTTYQYTETGAGVNAYVIDTGIRITHTQLAPRAFGVFTAISDGWGTNDCMGHGTHVAGTIGGTTYGIAKQVKLYAVRVLDCSGSGTYAGVIAGVNWVTANAIHPAVANMSLGGPVSPSLDAAVTSSIASGVTYAVAAGNSSADACTQSPADVPNAITVGATDPTSAIDDAAIFSNIGPCVDLFAPGLNITSAWNTSDTATNTISGTSMATPHVTGVAALYLQNHPSATPAQVWAAIDNAADHDPGTPGWGGVANRGAGSPNELLHWGPLSDGYNDGDPHITTAGGGYYNFQGAGEYVALRDSASMEIQTRQTPAPTAGTECVSLNTAVAARVGAHRVTFEPNVSGVPDPSGMQLRVDGILQSIGLGLPLGPGAQVVPSVGGGIEVDFQDGTSLVVTPTWWPAQSKWYLNVHVYHSTAQEGLMGPVAPGSWLPALPDGSSMGPMPGTAHQQYVDENQVFGAAWRITDATSLFDYAPGTSTATFTTPSWPPEDGPCVVPQSPPPSPPIDDQEAQKICSPIVVDELRQHCAYDVAVTGEPGFAQAYLTSQRIQLGGTLTTVSDDGDPSVVGKPVTVTATVRSLSLSVAATPGGTVQFTLDGENVGKPVPLDGNGLAVWKAGALKPGKHVFAANFSPTAGGQFLPSSSAGDDHTVLPPAGAPATTATLDGKQGSNGWFRSPVTVTLDGSAADGAAGSTWYTLNGGPAQHSTSPFTVDAEGPTILRFASTSADGVSEVPQTITIRIDATSPTITIGRPIDGGSYATGSTVKAKFRCDDRLSGRDTCVGAADAGSPIDTATPGPHTFTVFATDVAGNTAAATVSYQVG